MCELAKRITVPVTIDFMSVSSYGSGTESSGVIKIIKDLDDSIKDKHVIASGYNGAPKGVAHCSETGCLRQKMNVPSGQKHELCRGLHAEQNAIIQAACLGTSIEGATLYCTTQPCVICTKMIINAGIKRVVIRESYPDELAQEMIKAAGIQVDIMD